MSTERKLISVRDACCCCLSTITLHPLHGFQQYQKEKQENYANMISLFFSIQTICDESVFMICETCISRLRLAYTFIKQVEETQITLQHTPVNSKDEEIKIENIEGIEQFLEIDIAGNENFFSYESDVYENYEYLENDFDVKCEYNEHSKNENFENCEDNVDVTGKIVINATNIENKLKLLNKVVNKKKLRHYSNRVDSINNKNIKSVSKKISLNAHRQKSTEKPYEIGINDVTCKICNETFPLHRSLVCHMAVHFPNFICHVCGKYCTTNIKLKTHLQQHVETRHTCKICNKSYKGNHNFRKHVKCHFYCGTNYRCPKCPERFVTYYQRAEHLVEFHNDDPKKYKCKHCSKCFSRSNYLHNHIRNIHLQERKYICDYCESSFFKKATLETHILYHIGVKNYQCKVCHKSFTRKYTLTEHLRIHNNDKRFNCNICNRSFIQKCTLKSHMKVHEKEGRIDIYSTSNDP